MRKILIMFALLFAVAACGVSDKYIQTDAFEWSVELKNGDVASGTAGNEQEANKQINRFSKTNKSGIKKRNVKVIKVKTKRSKL